jgi:hypothetical protein
MRVKRRSACAIGMMASLMLLASCVPATFLVGAGAGVAGYMYVEGELRVDYYRQHPAVWAAVNQAARDLNIQVLNRSQDEISGTLDGKMASGTKVRITTEKKTAEKTRMTVRVGYVGDEKQSRIIEKEVTRALGIKTN